MDLFVVAIILIVLGGFNLFRCVKAMNNPSYLRNYIANSPKAFLWRKIFGQEKAYAITRKFFIPLGILLGVTIILLGLFFLYNLI